MTPPDFFQASDLSVAQSSKNRQQESPARVELLPGEPIVQSKIKNGGGGENRTRVQRDRKASIYKFSSVFTQSSCDPLVEVRTAIRDRDYVLEQAINR